MSMVNPCPVATPAQVTTCLVHHIVRCISNFRAITCIRVRLPCKFVVTRVHTKCYRRTGPWLDSMACIPLDFFVYYLSDMASEVLLGLLCLMHCNMAIQSATACVGGKDGMPDEDSTGPGRTCAAAGTDSCCIRNMLHIPAHRSLLCTW